MLSNLARTLSAKVKPNEPEPEPQDPVSEFFAHPLMARALWQDILAFLYHWERGRYQA